MAGSAFLRRWELKLARSMVVGGGLLQGTAQAAATPAGAVNWPQFRGPGAPCLGRKHK